MSQVYIAKRIFLHILVGYENNILIYKSYKYLNFIFKLEGRFHVVNKSEGSSVIFK